MWYYGKRVFLKHVFLGCIISGRRGGDKRRAVFNIIIAARTFIVERGGVDSSLQHV